MVLLHAGAVNCQLLRFALLALIPFASALLGTNSAYAQALPKPIIPRAAVAPTVRPQVKPPVAAAPKTGAPKAAVAKAPAAKPAATAPATDANATCTATLTAPDYTQILINTDRVRHRYESAHPSAKTEEAKKRFLDQAQFYIQALKARLDFLGIQYTEAEGPTYAAETELRWPILILSTKGPHRLNRYAAGVKRRYDTTVVIDHLFLRRRGSKAGFDQTKNALLLSEKAIQTERLTIDDMEEIVHMKFAAERDKRDSEIGHLPVQMFFVSSQPIIGEGVSHHYQHEMTFEDLWSQAMQVVFAANMNDDSQKAASQEERPYIPDMVAYLSSMADTVILAGERAKLEGLENGATLRLRKDESGFLIVGDPGQFQFGSFIPKEAISNAQDYSHREINDSQKLARFLQKHFELPDGMNPMSKEAVDHINTQALEFKGALMEFVKSLSQSAPSAFAPYEVIAWLELIDEAQTFQ